MGEQMIMIIEGERGAANVSIEAMSEGETDAV